ncbi:MAG: HAD family hydrolase [Solirubrobacteraceae bacterium]
MRALLLDALGTLVALEPPVPALVALLSERFGIALTPAQANTALAAEIAYYRTHLDQGRDAVSVADLRARCAAVLFAALPAPVSAAVRGRGPEELTATLLAALHFSAFPDARPAIAAARERGVRVVVVSNWDASLTDVLAHLGLAPLLDGVLTSAQVGARKPAPAIFQAALRLAGVEPGEAVHVGDSPAEDVDGARAAGIEPILISRDGVRGPAGVRTITSLAELGSALI